MDYNVSILEYNGRECELRIYPVMRSSEYFKCDDYGVKLREKPHGEWMYDDEWEMYGYVDDIDEILRRQEESKRCSLSRTKKRIYELSRGVEWEWFMTFTFSPDKVDRMEYSSCVKYFSKWLERMRLKNPGMKYMVVPEQHKKGGWHFHGIFCNICMDSFQLYRADGHHDYRVGAYKAGYSSGVPVKDELAVSNYITKYITKDMVSVTKGRKRYWASRNLKKPLRADVLVTNRSVSNASWMDVVRPLSDNIKYKSEVDTPVGSMLYLQLDGTLRENLSLLSSGVEVERVNIYEQE